MAQRQDLLCAGGYLPEPPGGRAKAPNREQSGNGAESARRRSLHLEHAQGLESECDVEGPFDVVLIDLALPRLLHALLQVPVTDPLTLLTSASKRPQYIGFDVY